METTATKAQEVKVEKPAEEKQTNCLGCGKPLRKIKRYYRNSKFYCNKKCWLKLLKSKAEGKEAQK